MDPNMIGTVGSLLTASGPYGLVAILGWWIFRITERKDRDLKLVYEKFIELSEQQVAGMARVEAALTLLREAISELKRSL